jgi:hypothetical protein
MGFLKAKDTRFSTNAFCQHALYGCFSLILGCFQILGLPTSKQVLNTFRIFSANAPLVCDMSLRAKIPFSKQTSKQFENLLEICLEILFEKIRCAITFHYRFSFASPFRYPYILL